MKKTNGKRRGLAILLTAAVLTSMQGISASAGVAVAETAGRKALRNVKSENDVSGTWDLVDDGVLYYGAHVYQYFEGGVSWNQAQEQCEALGGHLVTITSEKEQKRINTYVQQLQEEKRLTKQDIWIGAEMSDKKITWVTQEESDYTNWASGEPNNVFSMQDCAMMYTPLSINGALGYWNDENKNGRNWSGYQLKDIGYICEWETVYDYPEEQDFSDLELKQYIQNMPELSEEDARMFLAFVYNDSDYEDVDFMGMKLTVC